METKLKKSELKQIRKAYKLALDNFDEYYKAGLCLLMDNIVRYYFTSIYPTLLDVRSDMRENRPNNKTYWWVTRNKEKRKEWLRNRILSIDSQL